MKSPKGQAAMEYLMTYGWAILVVVAVVAALYGLGVFKVGTGSVKCSPCFSYFAYVDYADGVLMLKNGPTDVNGLNATAGAADNTTSNAALTAGQQFVLSGITTTAGTTQTVTLSYAATSSGLVHTDTAVIHN